MSKKYLGIDYGDQFIGLALADHGMLALPYKIIRNDESLWTAIRSVVADERITDIVIGMPVSLSGNENQRTRLTRAFAEELQERIASEIHFSDERLTTAAARARGRTRSRADADAAADILQCFLDSHERRD